MSSTEFSYYSNRHLSTNSPLVESAQLYLAEQVVAIERYAIEQCGIAAVILMKRAGRCAISLLLEQWPQVEAIQVFCGPGNNAGDGYVLAALAQQRGLDVTVWYLAEPQRLRGAALAAYEYAQQEQVICRPYIAADWSALQPKDNQVIVDALLGTGAQGEPRDDYAAAITAINESAAAVMAVDIPSGVNADSGHVAGVAVQADLTLSFVGKKRGLYTAAGRQYSGKRYLNDLAVPPAAYKQVVALAQVINYRDYLPLLTPRSLNSHKGDCGHLVVVGGDKGLGYSYGGAPILAAEMALRSGAGLVSVATRADFVAPALARQPEMMVTAIDNGQALLPLLARVAAVVLGPGLGRSAWSEQLFYHSISSDKPLVIDADALFLLAQQRFAQLPASAPEQRQWILTPHPGEAAQLLGLSIADIQADRWSAAAAIQQRYGGAVVLKGAGTVVVTSSGQQYLCDAGNPGMASGGMGDILSGLLGSLLVQGLGIDVAALLGVSLHSLAADKAAQQQGQRGLLATDVIAAARALIDGKTDV